MRVTVMADAAGCYCDELRDLIGAVVDARRLGVASSKVRVADVRHVGGVCFIVGVNGAHWVCSTPGTVTTDAPITPPLRADGALMPRRACYLARRLTECGEANIPDHLRDPVTFETVTVSLTSDATWSWRAGNGPRHYGASRRADIDEAFAETRDHAIAQVAYDWNTTLRGHLSVLAGDWYLRPINPTVVRDERWTQTALAAHLGCAKMTVNEWGRKKITPPFDGKIGGLKRGPAPSYWAAETIRPFIASRTSAR